MLEKLLIALRLKKKPEPKPAPAVAEPRRYYPPVGSRIPVPPPRRIYTAPVAQTTTGTSNDLTNSLLIYSMLNSRSGECSAPQETEPFRGSGGESGGGGAGGSWEPSPSYDSGSSYSSSSSDCGSSSDSSSSSSYSSD